jgi:hypothetical protein
MKVYLVTNESGYRPALHLGVAEAYNDAWARTGQFPGLGFSEPIPPLVALSIPGNVGYAGATITPIDLTMPELAMSAPEEIQRLMNSTQPLDKPQSEREAGEFLTKGLFKLAFFQEENPKDHRHATLHALINLLALLALTH